MSINARTVALLAGATAAAAGAVGAAYLLTHRNTATAATDEKISAVAQTTVDSAESTPLPSRRNSTPSPLLPTGFIQVKPQDQLRHLQALSDFIFIGTTSTQRILSTVETLDPEAKERFLRHATEHANTPITESNLTHPDSRKALIWALSEEVSRYVSLNHHLNQDEWNLLDFYIYEADGSRSPEPEFGKYHRMDMGIDNFMIQVQKILNKRSGA